MSLFKSLFIMIVILGVGATAVLANIPPEDKKSVIVLPDNDDGGDPIIDIGKAPKDDDKVIVVEGKDPDDTDEKKVEINGKKPDDTDEKAVQDILRYFGPFGIPYTISTPQPKYDTKTLEDFKKNSQMLKQKVYFKDNEKFNYTSTKEHDEDQ